MKEMIYYLVVYMVEALIIWQYFSSVFVEKYRVRYKIIIMMGGYLLLFLISLANIFWLNSVCFFTMNIMLGFFLYETTKNKICFHSLVATVAMNVSELLVMAVIGKIFSDFTYFKSEFTIFILTAVLCKLLYFLCVQVIIVIFGHEKETIQGNSNLILVMCVVPIVTMWVTLTLIALGLRGFLPSNLQWLVIVSATLMLALNIIIFGMYMYEQRINREYTNVRLQLQKESADAQYYKLLSEQNENQKILIHDMKKHLYTIDSLLEANKDSELKKYIANIIDSSSLKEKLHVCDNSVLNMILLRYKEICKENNIRFNHDVRNRSIEFLTFEDITALFGNILDNAVEAATLIESAFIDLNVRKLHNNTIIKLINSCDEEPTTDAQGNLISKKKSSTVHGIGMKSVEKVIKKYNGKMKVYYESEKKVFHTIVILNQ